MLAFLAIIIQNYYYMQLISDTTKVLPIMITYIFEFLTEELFCECDSISWQLALLVSESFTLDG